MKHRCCYPISLFRGTKHLRHLFLNARCIVRSADVGQCFVHGLFHL